MINLISPSCSTSGYLIADTYLAPNGSVDSIPQMTQVNGETVSAALEIQSTLGALLIPRMTITQRLALTAANGMMVYDTTLSTFYVYEAGSWQTMGSSSTGGVFGNFKVGVSPSPNTISFVDPTREMTIQGGTGGIAIEVADGEDIFLDGVVVYSTGNTGFADNVILTEGDYQALITDSVIESDTTSFSPTIYLPDAPNIGQTYKIIDTNGNAAANNIFIGSADRPVNGSNTNSATVNGTTFTSAGNPEFVVISPNGLTTAVGNTTAGTVTFIQNASGASTPSVVATVSIGAGSVGEIAFTPDSNRLFAVIPNAVAVISGCNTASPSLLTTVTGLSSASALAICPNGLYAWVVANDMSINTSWQLNNVSTGTPGILNTISGIFGSRYVAIAPDGSNAYIPSISVGSGVVNVVGGASTASPSAVYSIGDGVGTTVAWIAFSADSYTAVLVSGSANAIIVFGAANTNAPVKIGQTSTGVGTTPDYVIFSPTDNYFYISNSGSSSVSLFSYVPQQSSTLPTFVKTITVGSAPNDVVFTPNGKYVYVPNEGGNTVSVISNASSSSAAVTDSLTVGTNPYYMAITPNGHYGYVSDFGSGIVSYITNTGNLYFVDAITTNYAGVNAIYNGTQWNVY